MFLVHTTDGQDIIIDEEINVLKIKIPQDITLSKNRFPSIQRSGVSVEILLKYAHPP